MRKIRLLIVEDDPRIADIQRHYLSQLDFVELCGITHSLAEARDHIRILQPDLILLDVYFPDGNGLDLLREIRSANNASDIILITAATEVETLRTALHGGVFDYILKPVVYSRLASSLARYRDHLATLDGMDRVAQDEVDAFLHRKSAASDDRTLTRLPKGVDVITLDKVIQVTQGSGSWTAERVGQVIGASRTTARRYLEYLVSTGQLQTEVSYGGVGRPERRYIHKIETQGIPE